jgi:hypothetical protein
VLKYTGFVVLWECPEHLFSSPSGPHSASENSLFDFVETAYGSFVFGGASAFQVDGRCATRLPFGVSPVPPQLHLYEADPAKATGRTAAKLLKVLAKELDRQEKQQRRQKCVEQEKRISSLRGPDRYPSERVQIFYCLLLIKPGSGCFSRPCFPQAPTSQARIVVQSRALTISSC